MGHCWEPRRSQIGKYLSLGCSGRIWRNTNYQEWKNLHEHEVTELLARFRAGDRDAESRLLPLVYAELRRLAFACLNRERRDHTLEPTALVHEAFLRLTGGDQPVWQDRAHFLGVASRLMRQILVDYARQHRARKRGGSRERVSLLDSVVFAKEKSGELLLLDQALDRLAEQDERQSRIVEMKFFGGLGVEEIAEVLQLSPRTIKREWMMARAWLHREIYR
jgi:RNA polymerase sigma-70 factor (ECF subfamily)